MVSLPTLLSRLNRGSDRDCTFTYDLANLKLHEQQEIINPIPALSQPASQSRYFIPRTRIPEDDWEKVAKRNADGESLRQLAKVYGVSYEAIRQIVMKVKQASSPSSL